MSNSSPRREFIQTSLSRSFGPTLLFLNDLRELISILEKSGSEVLIGTKNYRYHSLEDLVNHERVFPGSLEFKISRPYVSVDLESNKVRLYIADTDDVSHRISNELREFFSRRERKLRFLYSGWACFICVPGFGGILAGSLIAEYIQGRSILDANTQLFVLFFPVIFAIFYFTKGRNNNSISFNERGTKSFFSRNRDAIIIALLAAIAGALASEAFDQLQNLGNESKILPMP